MGFYSASQLVQDSRRHGVVVLPVDVAVSSWEATLEPPRDASPAVRLGLNQVRGLEREAAWRIEEARSVQSFSDMHDLALRANLAQRELTLLASADALASLTGNRREALWSAAGGAPGKGILRSAAIEEQQLQLPAPSEAEGVLADYRHIGLTLGAHPLTFLRDRLHRQRFITAENLRHFEDGQLARGCGIVTVRQRPETAKGVVFLTLEDETGNVNVIVWSGLVEQQRREVMSAALLGVYGQWQCQNNVRHLVAKRLVDLSHLLGELETKSRDFH
jgi:error-prone DNA polymerase